MAERRPSSLQWRITLGATLYMLLLSLAVVYHGNAVNERAEAQMWRSLLDAGLHQYIARSADDPAYRWRDSDGSVLYGESAANPVPAPLSRLAPGFHEEVRIGGRKHVALVRQVRGRRLLFAIDKTGFEEQEQHLTRVMVASALGGLLLCGVLLAFGLRRLVSPLGRLARDIAALQPDRPGRKLDAGRGASAELVVIADAVNAYSERNARFVERERAFVDSASHELRTPVAVMAGAAEIGLGEGPAAPVRLQLQRIARTARDVEQLLSLLLVLAKDPGRLAASSDRFRLDELLPRIVEDHRHLCADKALSIVLGASPACTIEAPEPVVRAAIGNLLRNAIENSDRGTITVALDADAVVTIDDPGHGMSPGEIGALHARLARGDGREGGGIGLDLIARLCEHLGWTLRIAPRADADGTRAVLDFGASLRAST